MRNLYYAALQKAQQYTPATIGGNRWSNRHWSFCQLWGISPQVAWQWLAMDLLKETLRETQDLSDV